MQEELTLLFRPNGQREAVFVTHYSVEGRFVRFLASENSPNQEKPQPSDESGEFLGIVTTVAFFLS